MHKKVLNARENRTKISKCQVGRKYASFEQFCICLILRKLQKLQS